MGKRIFEKKLLTPPISSTSFKSIETIVKACLKFENFPELSNFLTFCYIEQGGLYSTFDVRLYEHINKLFSKGKFKKVNVGLVQPLLTISSTEALNGNDPLYEYFVKFELKTPDEKVSGILRWINETLPSYINQETRHIKKYITATKFKTFEWYDKKDEGLKYFYDTLVTDGYLRGSWWDFRRIFRGAICTELFQPLHWLRKDKGETNKVMLITMLVSLKRDFKMISYEEGDLARIIVRCFTDLNGEPFKIENLHPSINTARNKSISSYKEINKVLRNIRN